MGATAATASRHSSGRATSAHVPVFYLHLEPGDSFVGVGIWRPETATARQIRQAIVAKPHVWKRAVGDDFRATYKRPPAGIDPEHPLLDDLKRKSFIGMAPLTQRSVTSPAFVDDFAGMCRTGAPLIRFLCDASGAPF